MSNTYKDKFTGKLARSYHEKRNNRDFSGYSETYNKLCKEFNMQPNGWMNTPSWWVNQTMTRPQRRRVKAQLNKIDLSNYEDSDVETYDKKPHEYYW